jgi:hypothetical protein
MKVPLENEKNCLVAVRDRKTKAMRQCRNRRADGKCCVTHATAQDCGDHLEFVNAQPADPVDDCPHAHTEL